LFLKVQDLEFEQEGYENLTEMLESEKAELTEKNCQQQAEIEALKTRIERMIEKQSHYESMAHAGGFEAGRELGMKQERERNNEPVAWMFQGAFDISTYVSFEKPNPDIYPNPKPLYTHPVKDLEDIDINITWNENSMRDFGKDELAFARAILRKAQEK
jgi:hypothetical protein